MKLINAVIGLTTVTLLLGSPVLLAQKLKEPASTPESKADAEVEESQTDESSGVAGSSGSYSYGLITDRSPGGGNLIIHTSTPEGKEQSNLEEDMAVMGLILDKAVQEDADRRSGRSAMGIALFFTPGSGSMRNLYLDGYGVVFFKRVPFPLMAPRTKADTEDQETPTDSTWEAAKQELYGQPSGSQFLSHPGEEFNEERVSHLKETLLESLKNATNIRDLKPTESVTVCVVGSASAVGVKSTRTGRFSARTSSRGVVSVVGASPMHGTILTITAKKSDVDAYAKGKLNLEEFTRRARVAAYPGAADGEGDGWLYHGMNGGGGGGFGTGSSGVWSFGAGR